MKLQHIDPRPFVSSLRAERSKMSYDIRKLGAGVTDLLSGGTGYIGIAATYIGTLQGIDEKQDTFTYTDTHPRSVHDPFTYSDTDSRSMYRVLTGKLSDLITAIKQKSTNLRTAEPQSDTEAEPATYEVYRDEQDLLEQLKLRKPDGKFGPARQRAIRTNSWFLACLAAVAKDKDGRKLLAQSIKKTSVAGISGYHVTFAGLPHDKIFISDKVLENCLDSFGGDGDTRLIELAADRFFAVRGNFKALCLAYYLKAGLNSDQAETYFKQFCRDNSIKNPMTYNPMYAGLHTDLGYFLLADSCSKRMNGSFFTRASTIMQFLHKYLSKSPAGAAVVIEGRDNPLGKDQFARDLVVGWDAVRTDIISNARLEADEATFLNMLDQWLQTNANSDFKALKQRTPMLKLQHVKPEKFVATLADHRLHLNQRSVDIVRNAVRDVLNGGTGYIGFAGGHAGIIHGINRAKNTFTYTEPYFPRMVHTGKLSDLMTAIKYKYASLRGPDSQNDDFEIEYPKEEL